MQALRTSAVSTVRRSGLRTALLATLGAAAVLAAGAAQARDVSWSIGLSAPGVSVALAVGGGAYLVGAPTYVQPAPVYVQPAPVYVQPAPVYVRPAPVHAHGVPGPVYVRPAPVYVPPAAVAYGYGQPQWHHRHHRHFRDINRDGVPDRYQDRNHDGYPDWTRR